jgi:protoheme IX farnesyltransferase
MLIYTLILFPLSLAPYAVHIAGPSYLLGASILSGTFIYHAIRVLFDTTHASARRMFKFSIFYLTLLLLLLLAEHLGEVRL